MARPGATLPVTAVGHPVRIIVFLAVARRPLTAQQVADVLERPLGTVAYHLRALVDAEVVDELPDEEATLKDL